MRGTQRLEQDRGAPLVDRGGAHLHRGGRADGIPDDDQVDAVERELRDLSSAWPGEVDARRPGFPRRRSRDRSVHQLEFRGDLERGCGRDRVQLDEERRATGFLRRSHDSVSCSSGCFGRNDRENDLGLADYRREIGQELDLRPFREMRSPLAPTLERRDDARTASGECVGHSASHRAEAHDTDGCHCSAASHVSRDGEPAAVAASPHIRIPAGPDPAVGERVLRPRVDDRDVAEDPHVHVVCMEI